MLTVVVPCYNEEDVLSETISRLIQLLGELTEKKKVAPGSHVLFVDDGSADTTWQQISAAAEQHAIIRGLKLSRNRGHQIALVAGLMSSDGDIVISADADLQDDLDAIEKMIDAHADGADIVYGVRSARTTDTFFKRFTAEGYYWLLDKLGVDIVFNHADYRLMTRRTIEALAEYGESNLFVRGLIPQLGFPAQTVEYERQERFAGESKYPLRKMLSLALSGVTSFSVKPLRLITTLGIIIALISFGFGIWSLVTALLLKQTVPGWASTVVPLFFLGGVQIVSIGIIGEYVGRIYVETKRRPRYHIEALAGARRTSNAKRQKVDADVDS